MGAENNQPESALLADYYDPETDSNVKFESGADNEEGGNLVKDPSDATEGNGLSDVEGPGPSEILFQEDSRNETNLNDHVHATVDQPMGNTEDAERNSASGVTAYAKED